MFTYIFLKHLQKFNCDLTPAVMHCLDLYLFFYTQITINGRTCLRLSFDIRQILCYPFCLHCNLLFIWDNFRLVSVDLEKRSIEASYKLLEVEAKTAQSDLSKSLSCVGLLKQENDNLAKVCLRCRAGQYPPSNVFVKEND